MPTSIYLHVIRTADIAQIPDLQLDRKTLSAWFSDATRQQLDIQIVPESSARASTDMDAASLQQIMREVLPQPDKRPVKHISLIFCKNWRIPADSLLAKLYGLMFDYNGNDPSLSSTTFDTDNGVPREGAAVFLDDIGSDPSRIVYTAIHELGHVFNFRHDSSNKSFMALSGFNQRGFLPHNSDDLTMAAEGYEPYGWNFLPGGAEYLHYSDAPLLAERAPDPDGHATSSHRIVVKLAKENYLPGEPIVLDMELTAARGERTVPATFDPGYESTIIWYETPTGERLRYRPIVNYCSFKRQRVPLASGNLLKHNPRISLGSNGLNFVKPGGYRVWVSFRPHRGHKQKVCVSNIEEFEVIPGRNDADAKMSGILLDSSIAFFIANKGGALTSRKKRAIKQIAEAHPNHDAVRHVRYALGAAALKARRVDEAARWLRHLSMKEDSLSNGLERMQKMIVGDRR
jgi:hypothetical protein